MKEFKTYIKKIMTTPNLVSKEDYTLFSKFTDYDLDKCHICVLIMEAKKQTELLFVAKALTDYMS